MQPRILGFALLLFLAFGCIPAAQPTVTPTATLPPLPQGELARLLNLVPGDLSAYTRSQDFSSLAVYYMDRAGEAQAIGQVIPFSIDAYTALSNEERSRLVQEKQLLFVYGGIFAPLATGLGSGNFQQWKDSFGYEPLALRDALFVGGPTGMDVGAALVEGNYPIGAVEQVLVRNDFVETSPDFFALPGDPFQIHVNNPIQRVTGASSMMNRVAVARDIIIAGNYEDLVKALHQSAREGGGPDSLARNRAVMRMTEALGPVHFALVFPRDLLPQAQRGIVSPAPFQPPAEWGELHPWAWASVAYTRDMLNRARFTVALAYFDPSHAALDAAELKKRMETYRPMVFPRPPDGEGRQEAPLTSACTVREPRVSQSEDASALVISCSYDPLEKGHWWTSLAETWDLNFLYPQPAEARIE